MPFCLTQIGFVYDLVEWQRSGRLYSELCGALPEQACICLGGVCLHMMAEGISPASEKSWVVEVRAPLCQ